MTRTAKLLASKTINHPHPPPSTTMASSNSHTTDISLRQKTINLGAGPSTLPDSVLLSASSGILDFQQTGMGLTELSHRSSTFKSVIEKAESDLRTLLDIPEDYSILFQQGGGSEQFSATALNLLAYHAVKNPEYVSERRKEKGSGGEKLEIEEVGPPCDYVVTGSWSSKAMKEAKRMGANSRPAIDSRKAEGSNGKFGQIPSVRDWNLSKVEDKPAFLYYCDNETVDGVEFPSPGFPFQDLPQSYRENVPIVADCSSNILSRPIDIKSHSIIFFGAQKNVGPAGVTIIIVRKNLLVDPDSGVKSGGPRIPSTLVYKIADDNKSLYNTPSMFAIYVSGLTFQHLLQNGGVKGAEDRATLKSKLVYDCIENSDGVFKATVGQKDCRSKMNVTFRITRAGEPNDELEERFVKKCGENGIVQVKGHRSVGGIRTSLYNAVTVENVKTLVKVMEEFLKEVKQY